MVDASVTQTFSHFGVQFVERSEQHRMDAAGSERTRHQSVSEYFPAGDHCCASQLPHRSGRDPLSSRNPSPETVTARDALHGDPGFSDREWGCSYGCQIGDGAS